jgi:hypothetical protein
MRKPRRETPFEWKARTEAERERKAREEATQQGEGHVNRPKLSGERGGQR